MSSIAEINPTKNATNLSRQQDATSWKKTSAFVLGFAVGIVGTIACGYLFTKIENISDISSGLAKMYDQLPSIDRVKTCFTSTINDFPNQVENGLSSLSNWGARVTTKVSTQALLGAVQGTISGSFEGLKDLGSWIIDSITLEKWTLANMVSSIGAIAIPYFSFKMLLTRRFS